MLTTPPVNADTSTESALPTAPLGNAQPDTAPLSTGVPPIAGIDDLLPLTPAQTGMLFESLSSDDPELYFEQVRFDLVGPLDVARFRAAWESVHARHSMLRTVFLTDGVRWDGLDEPLQVVRSAVELPWTEHDWTEDDRPGADRSRLDALARQRRAAGIDLGITPLSTFDIVVLGNDRAHVIWGFHHLLLDGWSTAQVVGEVFDHYDGVDDAEPTDFRPYLEWLADRDTESSTDFWTALLASVDEPTTIGTPPKAATTPPKAATTPPKAATSQQDTFARTRIDAGLSAEDSARLRSTARLARVTVNTLVQAGWSRTLARYTGRDHVVFGVTIAGRPPELDGSGDTVGMFLNTLPFPVSVPDETTDAWLRQLQQQQLDIGQHGHASLAEVQRLAPTEPGTHALFDSILVFENYPMRQDRADATLAVEHYEVFEQSHYPLTIMAGDLPGRPDELGFIVVHDGRMFEPWFARQLVDDFLAELVRIGSGTEVRPDSGLQAGDVRPSDSVVRGDAELSAAIASSLDRATVDAAFAHRARANADEVAVRSGSESLTFAELDHRAGIVAAELRDRGVGPEVPVGIAIERSIDMVVAIVAVVRAGGCYLALDPSHPVPRLADILEDARCRVVLVSGRAPASIDAAIATASERDVDPLVLDLEAPEFHHPSPTPTTSSVTQAPTRARATELPGTSPDSTLFLTFTSGSAGRPKGVPVHHRGVLHRLAWQYMAYPPEAGEVGVAKTTLGFVDHLSELWGPLLAGQCVVLAPDAVVKDAAAFIELCAEHRIRRLVVVPSYLEALIETAPDLADRLPSLELLTTSGEALRPSLARRVAQALPAVRLLNIYGMSEATADVTCKSHEPGALADLTDDDSVSAGHPLPGIDIAIVGPNGAPLPRGVVGDVEVGGVALSAGYWRRPDLTDERFHERSDGERWYRTGDRGWLSSDGELHLAGRSDRQIKVRGMRVELDEIESAIMRHPLVDRCAVVVRPPDEIVAFVVSSAQTTELAAQLWKHVVALLPTHMVPVDFSILDALPLTPSGKVDRRSLESRGASARPSGPDPAAQTPAELGAELAAMVALWHEILPNAAVTPDTDFFDAGGHSLLALRLVARINHRFDAALSLAQMLEAPTPRSLANLVWEQHDQRSSGVESPTTLVPILPGSRAAEDGRRTLFCVHGAGGNVLNFRPLAKAIEGSFDLIGLQARGVDGITPPHDTMAEVVADYAAAIQEHQPVGPYLLAGYSGGGTIAVEIARALESSGQTVEATLLLDTFHNDTRPRPFTKEQHLEQLRRHGVGYLIEKVREKIQPGENESHAPAVADARAKGQPIPLEAREWFIKGRMYELIGSHRIEPYHGTVVLLAATDTHPGLVHTGRDHGWGETYTNLEIIDVEGDHHSLVEGHNAPEMGRLILDRLGAGRTTTGPTTTGSAHATPAADPEQGQPLDARRHVYRHLPTGLDETPLLARFIEPGHTVLDVGTAATGRSALTLEALGASVVSIEINHLAITEFAESDEAAASSIELTTADMTRLPFADQSFDALLIAFHGFDYLVDPADRARAITDAARVLRPGGHLIFNSFNTLGIMATPTGARSVASWKRRLRFLRSGELTSRRLVDDNGLGLHHGRPDQIVAEVEAAGLEFETITTLFGEQRHRLLVSAFAPEPNYVFVKR